MKIIFFGSDDFAAAHLKALLNSSHEVAACVTQPDKARGRGWKVTPSPVKDAAVNGGVKVLQPEDLKDPAFLTDLKGIGCDLFVVIAYGKFLPQAVLEVPRICAINVHSSLLPKYRGAAPINWAVINGDAETGLTIMKVVKQMDAGDIIAQKKMKIAPDDTAQTLRAKMTRQGPAFLLETIGAIEQKTFTMTPQDNARASLAPKLTKEQGHIRWAEGAEKIHNLVRGLAPWPTAYTFYKNKLLKILETELTELEAKGFPPGAVAAVGKEGFVVATGKGGLLVKKVHLEAARPMDAREFVMGHQLSHGFRFES